MVLEATSVGTPYNTHVADWCHMDAALVKYTLSAVWWRRFDLVYCGIGGMHVKDDRHPELDARA